MACAQNFLIKIFSAYFFPHTYGEAHGSFHAFEITRALTQSKQNPESAFNIKLNKQCTHALTHIHQTRVEHRKQLKETRLLIYLKYFPCLLLYCVCVCVYMAPV